MTTPPDDSHHPDDTLPDAFIRQLQESDRVPFEVTNEQHEQILSRARANLMRKPTRRPARSWLRATAVISSACAALLIFAVTHLTQPQDAAVEQAASGEPASGVADIAAMRLSEADFDPKDIDNNGTVNILDAYVLARRLEAGEPDGSWDFNSDGQLDEEDVRMVALDAVML